MCQPLRGTETLGKSGDQRARPRRLAERRSSARASRRTGPPTSRPWRAGCEGNASCRIPLARIGTRATDLRRASARPRRATGSRIAPASMWPQACAGAFPRVRPSGRARRPHITERHRARRNRESDPTGPDAELKRAIASCELRQEVDGRTENCRVEACRRRPRRTWPRRARRSGHCHAPVNGTVRSVRLSRAVGDDLREHSRTSAVWTPPFSWADGQPGPRQAHVDIPIGPAAYHATTQDDGLRREASPQVDSHNFASPQVAESISRTLSRWRHGFKSRWDYHAKRAGHRPSSGRRSPRTGCLHPY
jgi:hypothetical protein